MRRAATIALVIACAAALAACTTGTRPAQRYFVLQVPASAPVAASVTPVARHEAALLLAPASAASFYDTQEIAFSRAAGVRAYYQFSSWTESPAQRLDALLAARLERGGAFATVAPLASGVRGRWLLRVHLDEIYHDAATPPGVARVLLTAELTEPARRVQVARRSFSAAIPVATFDADGAVAGLGGALSQVLDELAAWTATAAVD